ncbi:deoxyribodipyrimidine photo-lyase [Yoonia sp. BS5-3]|uniref:Deoxyribodipyrimidine photo-lyase n=1 Tax=Yoonia phaeophyticola TaxID=3137369 RepID=A0ABZ2V077_9RHOB
MSNTPILLWFRRDLRLADHESLRAACDSGRPVIPVFVHDDQVADLGAAPRMRLGLSVAHFAQQLEAMGSRLILRKGPALQVLRDLVQETGAGAVYWSRLYDPAAKARDTQIKSALKEDGLAPRSFAGHLLFEPWTVETKTGGFYKVYTPMWKAVRDRDVPQALTAPGRMLAPESWPQSDCLDDWQMGRDMRRGASGLAARCCVGEAAARDRLTRFMDGPVTAYVKNRDLPGVDGTSRLSENLTYGEISPRVCWHAGWAALQAGQGDAEVFLKELVWREFAYHLAHHTPHITTGNWKPDWDAFPWNTDETDNVQAWKQGRTGVRFVDAAMREMYVTGTMHNRGRMIVASYLTKHLLTHWQIGLDWFADCLIDWDPCSNAMGWQWSAGSGPDATPYFRVFNPVTQLDKFDKDRAYVKTWIAEGYRTPSQTALDYFDMIPRSWAMSAADKYPDPVVPADEGRKRALAAYETRGF